MNKAILTAIAILALTSCHHSQKESTEEVAPIDVAQVEQDSVVIYHTYPGSLKATDKVALVGRVDGYLRSQNYQNGQLVEKGSVLFTIESSQYADQVNEARASLATAESNREYAAAQYTAMKKALESDAVSVMEVNKAKTSLEQAEASIRSSRAQLQTAQTNLGYCTIRAPYRGHVSASTMSVGSYVSGAASPVTLATLFQDATLYAEFFIDDKSMQEILLGDKLSKVNLDSIPLTFQQDIPQKYYAKLIYISPQVDSQTGTLTLRAEVDNKDGNLHDGMYVTISLPSRSEPKAMLVKTSAISTDQLGKYIYTVNDSNRVVYTPIKVGETVCDSMSVVESGVRPGDKYVTRALLKVREGMTVKPVIQK